MKANLRQKTLAVRRQHILDAAIEVFGRHGFHRATIRQIAEQAEVSDGTIYNTFADKAAILTAVLDPTKDREAGAVSIDHIETPEQAALFIRGLVARRWTTFTPQTLDALRASLPEVIVNDRLRQQFIKNFIAPVLTLPQPVFETLIARQLIRPVDIPLLLRTIMALLIGMVLLRLLGDPVTTKRWDALPDEVVELLLNGLLVDRPS